MSEVVSVKVDTFDGEHKMPAGYDAFDRLEINPETERLNGVLVIGEGEDSYERRVQLDAEKDWGVDPEDRKLYQENPEAWENKALRAEVAQLKADKTKLEERVSKLEDLMEQMNQHTVKPEDKKPETPPKDPAEAPDSTEVKSTSVDTDTAKKPEDKPAEQQPVDKKEPAKPAEIEAISTDTRLIAEASEEERSRGERFKDFLKGRQPLAIYEVTEDEEGKEVSRKYVEEAGYEDRSRLPVFLGGVVLGAVVAGAAVWLWKNGDNSGVETIIEYKKDVDANFNALQVDVNEIQADINHPDYGLEALDAQQETIINNQEQMINHDDWGLKAVDNQQEQIQRTLNHIHDTQHEAINNPDWGQKAIDNELEELLRENGGHTAGPAIGDVGYGDYGYGYESTSHSTNTTTYQYPWNWAEATAGKGNGSTMLFELAGKARADGNSVQWLNVVNGSYDNATLQVNGRTDTGYVTSVLNRYR